MRVFITGAAGGLGRAFANECARRGWDMFLTDVGENGLRAIKEGLLRRYDVSIDTCACDLTKDDDTERMLAELERAGGAFDMLINVAGIDCEGGFTQRSCRDIQSIVRVNVEATLRVTHKMLGLRAQTRPFYVIFVSSLASLYPMPLKATYAASKRFLADFAQALSIELRDAGVKVLSLCPGGMATTPDTIEKIAVQGMWGDLTTNRIESVVTRTITLSLRGRRRYIPGAVNRTLCVLGKLVPSRLTSQVVYARWKKAQAHRLGSAV